METGKTTKTMSLPGAAFVMAHGYHLPQIELNKGRFDFCWPDPDGKVDQLLSEYRDGDSTVARDYYRSLQDIRFAINRAKAEGVR
jgi:hypothetical protein